MSRSQLQTAAAVAAGLVAGGVAYYFWHRSNDSKAAAAPTSSTVNTAVAISNPISASAEAAAKYKASKEKVEIWDAKNEKVVDTALRADVRSKNLLHRSTYVFVINKKNEYLVQKRTLIKDYCPGYYEVCAGGVMVPGETYRENVEREVHEELGIAPHRLTLIDHGTFLYEDAKIRTFGGLWTAVFDGDVHDLQLQAEEVQSIHLQTYEQIQTAVKAGEKYTPDCLVALEMQRKAFSKK